jgi:N-methylhydantoinase B
LLVHTAGGGGYGDPFERDPAAVLADVLDGLVSVEQARRAYGVAIVDDTLDADGTAELRARPRPMRERFAFGAYREAFESRWPPELQAALNRVTEGLPAAPRQYVRRRLVEAIESNGGPVDLAHLQHLHQQVLAELELPLLETL